LFRVRVAVVALKSPIDDRDIMIALCDASRIRERPRAAGTAKSPFCGRMFPNQNSFRLWHAPECTSFAIRFVSLIGQMSLFPRHVLSGLFAIFASLIHRK